MSDSDDNQVPISEAGEAAPVKEIQSPATPWHLWVIGVIALLWSSMEALD